MAKTLPVANVHGLLGFDYDVCKYTLEDVINAAKINFPGVPDCDLWFMHIGGMPYDLILLKKSPVEFYESENHFGKTVSCYITLEQVKKEAESLPDFRKYGFSKVKFFWNKWDFCMSVAKEKPAEPKSDMELEYCGPGDCGGIQAR